MGDPATHDDIKRSEKYLRREIEVLRGTVDALTERFDELAARPVAGGPMGPMDGKVREEVRELRGEIAGLRLALAAPQGTQEVERSGWVPRFVQRNPWAFVVLVLCALSLLGKEGLVREAIAAVAPLVAQAEAK